MKCGYCGRTNHDDGHGGCYSCGAPVKQPQYQSYSGYEDGTCVGYCASSSGPTSYVQHYPVSRKRVILG